MGGAVFLSEWEGGMPSRRRREANLWEEILPKQKRDKERGTCIPLAGKKPGAQGKKRGRVLLEQAAFWTEKGVCRKKKAENG